jgi:hypothetical protein
MNTKNGKSVSATSPVFLKQARTQGGLGLGIFTIGIFTGIMFWLLSLFPTKGKFYERRNKKN